MSSDLQQALTSAGTLTFEQLGFVFAEVEVTEEQRSAPIEATARVSFEGPMNGVIELRIAGILAEVAANMLGADETPDQAILRDAAGELANVVSGNALPAIGGAEAVFNLGAPEVTLGEAPDGLGDPTETVEIGLEEGRAEIAFFVTQESVA